MQQITSERDGLNPKRMNSVEEGMIWGKWR
jgi:hypothetical protein